MKILIIITAVLASVWLFKSFIPPTVESICYSEQCKSDLEYLNSYYQKEREESYKKYNSPKKVKGRVYNKNGEFVGETECEQVINKITCKKGDFQQGGYYYIMASSTVDLDMSKVNMTFAMLAADNKLREQSLKDNQCPFNLICRNHSYEEIIHQTKIDLENKNHPLEEAK